MGDDDTRAPRSGRLSSGGRFRVKAAALSAPIKLLPCPFCGGRNVCERADDGYVSCADCHAYGPDGDSAIKSWNTRTLDRLSPNLET
jgi:hypothetical protein